MEKDKKKNQKIRTDALAWWKAIEWAENYVIWEKWRDSTTSKDSILSWKGFNNSHSAIERLYREVFRKESFE